MEVYSSCPQGSTALLSMSEELEDMRYGDLVGGYFPARHSTHQLGTKREEFVEQKKRTEKNQPKNS